MKDNPLLSTRTQKGLYGTIALFEYLEREKPDFLAEYINLISTTRKGINSRKILQHLNKRSGIFDVVIPNNASATTEYILTKLFKVFNENVNTDIKK